MKKVVLIGSGGHARSVVDSMLVASEYEIVGFVSNEFVSYRGITTIGCDDCLYDLHQKGVSHAFVCLGYLGVGRRRQAIVSVLEEIGYRLATVVDPSAVLASDANIGRGSFVGKLAVVNSKASIGKMAIVNTAAVVEHDCFVGDYAHISVNAALCGAVHVDESAFIGAGAVILQGVRVGSGAIVGANSTVLADVGKGARAVGVYNGK